MNRKNLLLVCFLLAALIGCAAPPIKPVDSALNKSNSSTLYMSRAAQFVNAGVGYRVFVNGDYIGELWGGGQIVRPVTSGKALIEFKPYELGGIPSIGSKEISLDLEVGYEYHLSMDSSVNSAAPIGSVVAVEKSLNIQVTRKKIE
jgi:hypothetical protein